MSNDDNKFNWLATDSGPNLYPMEIIRSTLIYKDEVEKGLYVPSGVTLDAGWGQGISHHVVGEKYKPLPDRLTISFFSYTEKQFYKGIFKLPYDKILALFIQGVKENPEYPAYSEIMVGVAPGGIVAVWVHGQNNTEVFFGHADKINLDYSAAFALPFKNKEQVDTYIDDELMDTLTPEELASLKKNGVPFGLWERYRNLYDWRLTLKERVQTGTSNIKFLNGDFLRQWVPVKIDAQDILRPVPRRASFKATVNGQRRLFTITFDEFEIMDAFEKLGVNNQKVYLEFEPRLPREDTRVRIYNDKESITLKKYKSKK